MDAKHVAQISSIIIRDDANDSTVQVLHPPSISGLDALQRVPRNIFRRDMPQPGRDAPFHLLQEHHAEHAGVGMIGAALQDTMDLVAEWGAKDQVICPPPSHDCELGDDVHLCSKFRQQWLLRKEQEEGKVRYVGDLSDQMAEYLVKAHLEQMHTQRSMLQEKLKSHGDIILKRWQKMSKEKRAILLSSVAPRIFGPWSGKESLHKSGWLFGSWAYTEDFMEDRMKLLSVLHVRAECSPASWAPFDMRQAERTFVYGKRSIWHNGKCLKMYGDDYGTLVEPNGALIHSWTIVGFPRAFMTIQAQLELLSALFDIAAAITGDAKGTGSAKWDEQSSKGFAASGQIARWSVCLDQAFTTPAVFTPQAMLDLAKSRLQIILDDIWLLQTEPAYLQQVLKTRKADVSNIGLDHSTDEHIDTVVANIVIELLHRVGTWRIVVELCEEFCEAFERQRDQCIVGKILPREIDDQIVTLAYRMQGQMKVANAMLGRMLPLKLLFNNIDQAVERLRRIGLGVKHGGGVLPDSHSLPYHLSCLRENVSAAGPLGSLSGLSDIFQAIQMEIDSNATLAQQIDKRSAEILADIAAMDELCGMLTWSQLGLAIIRTEAQAVEIPQTSDGYTLPTEVGALDCSGPVTAQLRPFIKELLDVPWPRHRRNNMVWLEKASKCRQKQAEFWAAFRAVIAQAAGNKGGESPMGKEVLKRLADFEFDLDPAFLSELEIEREACRANTAETEMPATSQSSHPEADHIQQTIWGEDSHNSPVRCNQTKSKAARDVLSPLEDENEVLPDRSTYDEEAKSSVPKETIAVGASSLALFQKMYRAERVGSQAADVQWRVFLQAMADTGVAVTQASGSAVRLSNDKGSICVHKPHPDSVVNPIMLHNIGKRMNKWFGWTRDTFVLKS